MDFPKFVIPTWGNSFSIFTCHLQNPPSAPQAERSHCHTPRVWRARDACLDTSELRCYTGPRPCVLTLYQSLGSLLSCLTTLHLERVGLTHIVLASVPRLKTITLENCPALTSILLFPLPTSAAAPPPDVGATDDLPTFLPLMVMSPAPSLRRVRIIRCPKFAIYNWLGAVASLYPYHEENIFITFRWVDFMALCVCVCIELGPSITASMAG